MSETHKNKSGACKTGSELTAKKLFRRIWEHGQRIEQVSKGTKHTIDLFQPELESLRKKFCDKCLKILLINSSYLNKAEELLWKRGFYDVVQRCKQHTEIMNGSSPLFQSYSNHISGALKFYNRLLRKLEHQFGVEHSQLSQIGDSSLGRIGAQELKDVMYKCFIHLGDLARYQVNLGGNTYTAVAYYHKAITLDPAIGIAFNQLAVLVDNKNHHLDSIYYYQRSITSAQPFSGSEANMISLFEKNHKVLEIKQASLPRTKEPDMRDVTKEILFLQFIKLQQVLHPGNKTTIIEDKYLRALCEETLDSFKQCLEYDYQSFKEASDDKISDILSGKHNIASDKFLLPQDILLKFIALSILPSHSLRQLGSTLTPTATAFALSVFSQLLEHSFQCIAQAVVSAINAKHKEVMKYMDSATVRPKEAEIFDDLKHGRSIVDIIMEHNLAADIPHSVADSKQAENLPKPQNIPSTASKHKFKKHKIVDRRRRRKGKQQALSSEEESGSDSDSLPPNTSDESLSLLSDNLGEDDLELLDSLSESSSSEEEEEEESENISIKEPALSHGIPISKRAGRRQIILAANFNMPPSSTSLADQRIDESTSEDASKNETVEVTTGISSPLHPVVLGDDHLSGLVKDTVYQTAVYTACCLVSEEISLMALRVFIYWLQSYPIIIATCTQSSATMWSRIACLLNILPTQQDIVNTNVAGSISVNEQRQALLEDVLLRKFSPLALSQESLEFGKNETLSKIQEASHRICSLQTFGHFLAEARTAPSFTWDRATKKFVGPVQKAYMEQDIAKAIKIEDNKQAELNRSKLMKAMAQQRLQSEVKTLAEATSKTEGTIFTPYLIPDASSLCTGLHIVKKLIKTEKFIFIIAKEVIESLDSMKKGRESYTAREAIKFLEKELQSGNKFIQPQKLNESLNPGKKKPIKMEMQDWLFERLADCACYFNQIYAEKGQSQAVVTLIIEKRILEAVNDPSKQAELSHVVEVLTNARQSGVDMETIIGFHIIWSKTQKKRMLS